MNIEQPPVSTETSLSTYLVRMFNLVDTVYGNIGKLPIYNELAPKPVIGKMYYYSQALSGEAVVDAEGLYIYKSTGYAKIV